MYFEVFFEKGNRANKPTRRTPSMRETHEVIIECDVDDPEKIKKIAQVEMRKQGKKGFRYHRHKQVPAPERDYWNDLVKVIANKKTPDHEREVASLLLNQMNTAGGKNILRNELDNFFAENGHLVVSEK